MSTSIVTEFKVVGMKKHYYIGKNIDGHNCKFTYHDEEMVKYILCLVSENKKYELSLYETFDQCYSGWTTASFGNAEIYLVSDFGALTHVPKKEAEETIKIPRVNDELSLWSLYHCPFFKFSENGKDDYYPSGYVEVNEEMFEETKRGFKCHPVWIFMGQSNSGKSFLAHQLKEVSIFETDSHENLPEKIIEDVVVIGGKYPHTLENVKSRIMGEAVVVNFSK